MFFDKLLHNHVLVQIANQNHSTIGSYSWSLERDLERLILLLAHLVCTFTAYSRQVTNESISSRQRAPA